MRFPHRPSEFKKLRFAYVAAFLLVVAAAGWVTADGTSLYLRIRHAFLRSKPSLSGGEGKDFVAAGQAFETLERSADGDWVKVRFERKAESEKKETEKAEGWIHATVLGERPPRLENAEHTRWVKEGSAYLKKDAPKPSQSAAYAQARNLRLEPVLGLEPRHPSADELERFLRDGRLGLYRPDWPSLPEEAGK